MRISVFTREERETKKIISFFQPFFNLVLDQLQLNSDLTYFRNEEVQKTPKKPT